MDNLHGVLIELIRFKDALETVEHSRIGRNVGGSHY